MTENEKKLLKAKSDIFKALGHPTRLWIVEKLEKGETCVCEFVNAVGVDFSTISSHLSILKKAGLVESDKRGKEVYYSLKVPCVLNFMNCIENVIKKRVSEDNETLKCQEGQCNGN